MTVHDGLQVGGVSRLRAWRRGVLTRLMAEGMNLREAQAAATRAGACTFDEKRNNLVTSSGLNLAGLLLTDQASDGLTYHAIGTSATAPTVGDTALGAEVARKLWTTRSVAGATATLSAFYLAAECSFAIEEAGVFGNGASATADSGTLYAHYLQSKNNAAGAYDLTFDYEITFS